MHRSSSGQAAISMVFIIGGIIVLFATMLAITVLSYLNATYGFQSVNRAEAAAEGGISDAMLQLERSDGFSSNGYCIPFGTPPCSSGTPAVVVVQNSPTNGQVTVTSAATVSGFERKLQAIYDISTSTGLVELVTLQPLSL